MKEADGLRKKFKKEACLALTDQDEATAFI